MYDQAGFLWANRRSPATILTWLLLSSSLVLLICLVLVRHGNLAWDDADYLRRGLADARHATSGTTLAVIPRLLAGSSRSSRNHRYWSAGSRWELFSQADRISTC